MQTKSIYEQLNELEEFLQAHSITNLHPKVETQPASRPSAILKEVKT